MSVSLDTEVASLLHLGLLALGFYAIRRRSRGLGSAALAGFGAMLSGFFLMGWLAMPAIWLTRRFRPGWVTRWALPASMALGAVIVWARLPWPRAMPIGPTTRAQAHVTHVVNIDRIWVWRSHARGPIHFEQLPRSFDRVELEVPTADGGPPVTAVDSVDAGSVPGLGTSPTTEVVLPAGRPAEARLAAGQRTWVRRAFAGYVLDMYAWGTVWLGLAALITRRRRRAGPLPAAS